MKGCGTLVFFMMIQKIRLTFSWQNFNGFKAELNIRLRSSPRLQTAAERSHNA